MQETRVQSLGREDFLEKEMTTHSSIPTWRIPWTEEPGGLQSVGLQRVGHDWICTHTQDRWVMVDHGRRGQGAHVLVSWGTAARITSFSPLALGLCSPYMLPWILICALKSWCSIHMWYFNHNTTFHLGIFFFKHFLLLGWGRLNFIRFEKGDCAWLVTECIQIQIKEKIVSWTPWGDFTWKLNLLIMIANQDF